MPYIVRIDRTNRAGVRAGAPRVYEARDEADALPSLNMRSMAANPTGPRVATVMDAKGRLLFTYTGRAEALQS